MNKTESIVFSAAKQLLALAANNTVTTLEIKMYLRKNSPTQAWYQNDISDIMDKLQAAGHFTFVDNGTHRVYSLVKTTMANVTVYPTPTPAKTATPAPTKATKLSRTKAMDMIQNSKGQFFTVIFIKKDGTERMMNAQYSKQTTQAQAKLGYIAVHDIADGRKVKNVNTQTMKGLSIGGKLYKIN